jgi:gliding motility-associated lipoprotein GldH
MSTVYICAMKSLKNFLFFLVPCTFCLVSCTTVDLYEKTVAIPGHSWKSSFKPSFNFTIKDTSTPYQLYFVIRHNDKYSFNNIYVNLKIQLPGSDTTRTIRRDLTLATNEKGWLASGMDDIYEHRIKLGETEMLRSGDYHFTLEQIMREDPLDNVLNVGIRVEKQ